MLVGVLEGPSHGELFASYQFVSILICFTPSLLLLLPLPLPLLPLLPLLTLTV